MSELYQRVLLWHRLICLTTGGLALCSAKKKLNRTEALSWIEHLRNVADDVQAALDETPSVLDSKGRRVVGLDIDGEPLNRNSRFFNQEGLHEAPHQSVTEKCRPPEIDQDAKHSQTDVGRYRARVSRADRNHIGKAKVQEPQPGKTGTVAAGCKTSGPRVATRKRT